MLSRSPKEFPRKTFLFYIQRMFLSARWFPVPIRKRNSRHRQRRFRRQRIKNQPQGFQFYHKADQVGYFRQFL